MAGPFHHNVRGDAEGEGIDDEGAAAGVGADEFPLGLDLVGADVALVGCDADLLVDTGQAAQLLDVAVHRLVGVVRKGPGVVSTLGHGEREWPEWSEAEGVHRVAYDNQKEGKKCFPRPEKWDEGSKKE